MLASSNFDDSVSQCELRFKAAPLLSHLLVLPHLLWSILVEFFLSALLQWALVTAPAVLLSSSTLGFVPVSTIASFDCSYRGSSLVVLQFSINSSAFNTDNVGYTSKRLLHTFNC